MEPKPPAQTIFGGRVESPQPNEPVIQPDFHSEPEPDVDPDARPYVTIHPNRQERRRSGDTLASYGNHSLRGGLSKSRVRYLKKIRRRISTGLLDG